MNKIDQEFSTCRKDERSRKFEKILDMKDEDGAPRNPQILQPQALSTRCHSASNLTFLWSAKRLPRPEGFATKLAAPLW